MTNNKLEVKDIQIDILQILKNELANSIKKMALEDIVVQNFNIHISDDQLINDKTVEPNDLYFIFSRGKPISMFDNDVIPFSLYAYCNNAYIDAAREILSSISDVVRGYEKVNYITYVDTSGNILTVNEETYLKAKANSEVDTSIEPMFTQFTETFEKPQVLTNEIPMGTVYFNCLVMAMTVVLNKNVNSLDITKLYYLYRDEANAIQSLDIDIITASLSFSVEHDIQPFYFKHNNIAADYISKEIELSGSEKYPNIINMYSKTQVSDITESVAKYGVLTLSIVIPFKNNIFTQKIIEIMGENIRYSSDSANINSNFYFNLTFLNGLVLLNNKFKLKELTYGKTPGEADVIQLSFTN